MENANKRNETGHSSSELTLPYWINEDTAHGEKGKLQYIDLTGRSARFRLDHNTIPPLICITIAGLLTFSSFISEYVGVLVVSCSMATLILTFGLILLSSALRTMPFCIYENGFSRTKVSLSEGLQCSESFIPWKEIRGVGINQSPILGFSGNGFQIIFLDPSNSRLFLGHKVISHPFQVLKILVRLIPEKVDEGPVTTFMGDQDDIRWEDDPKVLKIKSSLRYLISRRTGFLLASTTIMNIYLIFAVMPFTEEFRTSSWFWSHLTPSIIIISAILFCIGYYLDQSIQKLYILRKSDINPNGISYPRTFLRTLIDRKNNVISWREIWKVRLELHPKYYFPISEIITNQGLIYFAPNSIYSEMVFNPDFIEEDFEYTNNGEDTEPSEKNYPQLNIPGFSLLILILFSPILLAISLQPGYQFFIDSDPFTLLSIFVALNIIYWGKSYFILPLSRLYCHPDQTVRIAHDGISINDKFGTIRRIPRSELETIELKKGLFGTKLFAKFRHDSLTLCLDDIPALQKNGYYIDGVLSTGIPTSSSPTAKQIPLPSYLTSYSSDSNMVDPVSSDGSKSMSEEDEEGSETANPMNPGKLLFTEPLSSVRRAQVHNAVGGLILLLFGLLLIVIALISMFDFSQFGKYGEGYHDIEIGSAALLLMIGVGSCSIASLGFTTAILRKPMRFHENGVYLSGVVPNAGNAYLAYDSIPSQFNPTIDTPEKIQFRVDVFLFLTINKKWEGIQQILPSIQERIMDSEKTILSLEIPTTRRKLNNQVLMTGVVMALGFGIVMLLFALLEQSDVSTIYSFSRTKVFLYGAPLSLVLFVIGTYWIEFKGIGGGVKRSPGQINLGFFWAVVSLLVGILLIGFITDTPSSYDYRANIEGPPPSFAYSSGAIVNETLVLDNNIYVTNLSTLRIQNCTITFNVTQQGSRSIFVAERGHLEIIDSTIINGSGYKHGYIFEIHGSARLINSTFSGLHADEDHMNGDGGIEIFSDNVQVSNCTISNNRINGILINDASPLIENCLFEGNLDDAIEIHRSGAKVLNCTFRNNDWAMIIFMDSYCVVKGNQLENNSYGIHTNANDVTIANNTFLNHSEYAIGVSQGCDPNIQNNSFENNRRDQYESTDSGDFLCSFCSFTMLVIGLIFTIIIHIATRRRIGNEVTMTMEEIDKYLKHSRR